MAQNNLHAEQPNPIFIVGTPRSGTTLLRLILDSHSRLAIAPESAFLFRLARSSARWYGGLRSENFARCYLNDIRSLNHIRDWYPKDITTDEILKSLPDEVSPANVIAAFYLRYAAAKGKIRWGDKTPRNVQFIDELLGLFPQGRIVIVIRDCRDVALSLKRADFGGVSSYSAARRWRCDAQFSKRALSTYPEQVLLVKYEELVADPEKQTKRILSFLDEEWDPLILERYLEHQDDVPHSKSELFRMPISSRSVNKWQVEMPREDIEVCEAVAGAELAHFGYERVVEQPTLPLGYGLRKSLADLTERVANPVYRENYKVLFRLLTKRLLLSVVGR